MLHRPLVIHFTIAMVWLSFGPLSAQSDNYWSWNFNTPSTLLAGAVVGGSAGPSAVFYNPALIDHEQVPSLSLSASLVSLQFFDIDGIAGEGIDASKFIFKVQPRFISYIVKNKNDRLGMEVAILSPVSEEINYTLQHFDELDVINRTVGDETYSGYLNYSRKFDDTWAGMGFSYKVNDRLYFGLSTFISAKILRYEYTQKAEAFQEGDSVLVNERLEPKYIAYNTFEEQAKYWDLSLVFKGGFQYKSKSERFSIGGNITFPNIRLYGEADVRKSFARSNVYNDESDAFTSNEIFIDFEEKARTRVKTPFSTALGLQYFTANRRNAISLTMEYFHSIDPYAVIDIPRSGDEFMGFDDNPVSSGDFMSYYHSARSVTNIGFGFKQFFSEKFMILGGFRTDFTSANSDNLRFLGDKFKINQIHLDKYHITAGPVIRIKNFNVINGIQYTFGRSGDMNPLINYAEPQEFIPQTGQALQGIRNNQAKARQNEITLFFGVTVDFNQ